MAKGSYRLTGAQRDPAQLNWAGQPTRPGESYGGKPEHISDSWSEKLVKAAAKQRHCAVTEKNMAEIFANGAHKLTKAEAAKLLERKTGAHRTSCYRYLRPNGPFARHLHTDGNMLTWRQI
jgi:hypothetical protein